MNDAPSTRDRLLTAAEREMAIHGIEGADLKRIQAIAGSRNRSSVNYYFGDRDGLVAAIGEKHRAPIDADRATILDRLEADGAIDLPELVRALVLPPAARLDDQSSRDYLVILAEATARHGAEFVFEARDIPHMAANRRLHRHLFTLLTGSPKDKRLRIGQAVLVATALLADLARAIEAGPMSTAQRARRVDGICRVTAAALRA